MNKALYRNQTFRISTLIMVILMVSLSLFVHIGAAEDTADPIYNANNDLLKEKYGLLLQLKAENVTSPTGQSVNNYIHIYDEKLNNLDKDLLYSEEAADVINLHYTQGTVTNRVAWIYFSYVEEFEGDARAAIDKVHHGIHTATENVNGLQDEIANATDATDLEELASLSYNNGGLCARMYVAVFEQKLLSLLKEDDSDAVKAIIIGENGAIKSITKCTDVTTSAQYDAIYQKAAEDVTIRRNKDKAVAELKKVYGILHPDGDPAKNETVTGALARINATETTLPSQMNAELKSAIATLLEEIGKGAGAFVTEYMTKLNAQIAATVFEADAKPAVADLSVLFEYYELDLARAETKDAVASYIAEKEYKDHKEMTDLATEYNGAKGILEGCATVEDVAFEKQRAILRIDLYGEYLAAVETIEGWVGETELSTEAYDQYDYAKYRITKTDRAQEDAINVCKNEYDKGLKALDELVVEAEVRAYEPKHAEILNKDPSKVTASDKEAIAAAIKDMTELSDGAQKVFEEKRTPNDLADKYKTVAELEIKTILGSTSDIRKDHAYGLTDKLDAIAVSGKADDLAAQVTEVDAVVKKAEQIDRVLDRYDAILADEKYASFSEENRKDLEDFVKKATEELENADVSDGKLIGLSNEAILGLDRREACAIIDATAAAQTDLTDATKTSIETLVENAKQAIGEETDAEKIGKLTEEALFDIGQELDIQDLTAVAEEKIKAVYKMDVLSEAQKKAHEDTIRTYVAEQSDRIRRAKDESAHKDAVNDMNKRLEDLLKAADKENETERENRKREAGEELRAAHEKTVAELNGKNYLSDSERTVLKQAADLALAEGLQEIERAHAPAEIVAAKDEAASILTWVSEEGEEQNLAAGRVQQAASSEAILAEARGIIAGIEGKLFLTAKEKIALKQDVESAVIEFSDGLGAIKGTDELEEAKRVAIEKLNAIASRCDEQDLGSAKEAVIEEIETAGQELTDTVDGFHFLEKSERQRLRGSAEKAVTDGKAAINACDSTEDVLAKRDAILSDLDTRAKEAQAAEDEACVKTLTPFMIGLAVAFAAEAVALLVLWLVYRKKSAGVACFAPVLTLALMPTPLAWTLTVLLSLADLAMAVLVVYLIVKICKLRRPANEPFPEDVAYEEDEAPEADSAQTTFVVARASTDVTAKDGEKTALAVKERKANRPALKGRPKLAALLAPMQRPKLEPKPQLIYLLPPAMPEIVPAVTVTEADHMISDEDALHCEQTNLVNPEVYTGKRKATVNLDLIGRSFGPGDLVSLNTLKEKGLISQKVGHVKILGKGALDKPLTVVAQNFSASAVKMIVLTGGSAILAEGSPERRHK